MFKVWVNLIAFLFLAVCAVFDFVKKQIPLIVVWIGIVTALLLQAGGRGGAEELSWASFFCSILIGVSFWLLSFITKEKVGYGDGWLLIMIGLFCGFRRCFLILLAGLVMESAVVLLLLWLKKIKRDGEIAFAPFLLLGMGVTLWL